MGTEIAGSFNKNELVHWASELLGIPFEEAGEFQEETDAAASILALALVLRKLLRNEIPPKKLVSTPTDTTAGCLEFGSSLDELMKRLDAVPFQETGHIEYKKGKSADHSREIAVKGRTSTNGIDTDPLGSMTQKLLPSGIRKRLAANYTPVHVAAYAANSAAGMFGSFVDPFCGSGRMLSEVMRDIARTAVSTEVSSVVFWANDLSPLFSLVAAYRLHSTSIELKLGELIPFRILVSSGDALLMEPPRELPCPICVITNPPFTRFLRLPKSYREELSAAYGIPRHSKEWQLGLHVYALHRASTLIRRGIVQWPRTNDAIMKTAGKLIAIIPTATFTADYASSALEVLNELRLTQVVIPANARSFSDASAVSEMFLILEEQQRGDATIKNSEMRTALENVQHVEWDLLKLREKGDVDEDDERSTSVTKAASFSTPLTELHSKAYWRRVFSGMHNDLLAFLVAPSVGSIGSKSHSAPRTRITTTNTADHATTQNEIKIKAVRGFEMFGPEFFFVPSPLWDRAEIHEKDVVLASSRITDRRFTLPRSWFKRGYWKLGMLDKKTLTSSEQLVLCPPIKEATHALSAYRSFERQQAQRSDDEHNLHQLGQYLHDLQILGANLQIPASRRYGGQDSQADWILHISRQWKNKFLGSRLMVSDKVHLANAHSFCLLAEHEPTLPSKNFYSFATGSDQDDMLLCAWMNSNFYLYLHLGYRRELGSDYGRFQLTDFAELPVLYLAAYNKQQICQALDTLARMHLPPLNAQHGLPEKQALDMCIRDAIEKDTGIHVDLEEMYAEIRRMLTQSASKQEIIR